jgi:hypothetical protein
LDGKAEQKAEREARQRREEAYYESYQFVQEK